MLDSTPKHTLRITQTLIVAEGKSTLEPAGPGVKGKPLAAKGSQVATEAATPAKARASQPLAAKAEAAKANRMCFSLVAVVFGSAMTFGFPSRVPGFVAGTSKPRRP